MFLSKKKKKHQADKLRNNPEVKKALKWLESTHHVSCLLFGKHPYHYVDISREGQYMRVFFYRGTDKRLLYVVLSDEERKEIEKTFNEKMGGDELYVYQDTIYSEILCGVIQHRFFNSEARRDLSRAYMTDDGIIGYGELVKED